MPSTKEIPKLHQCALVPAWCRRGTFSGVVCLVLFSCACGAAEQMQLPRSVHAGRGAAFLSLLLLLALHGTCTAETFIVRYKPWLKEQVGLTLRALLVVPSCALADHALVGWPACC